MPSRGFVGKHESFRARESGISSSPKHRVTPHALFLGVTRC
jgi:hypothetical protein